jgi:mRNA-degrading endonuclease RelE of RelBE toxin-antitoxin system
VAAWTVSLRESVVDDLRALGGKQGRAVLKEATARLSSNPLATTRHIKSLRAHPVAHRELRLFGRYRVLFSLDEAETTVTIVLVGEKRGNSLYVQGKRFTAHESRSTERS